MNIIDELIADRKRAKRREEKEKNGAETIGAPKRRPLDVRGAVCIPSGTDLARQVDQSIAALQVDPDLYVRAGSLTRVIPSDGTEAGPIKREVGAPVMRRCDPSFIRERLSLHAVFTTWKTKGRGENKETVEVEIQAPGWIAMHVIARGTWPAYRQLIGIVTAPTMRRDGSVVQMAGYDAASGLLYVPNATYRTVPDEPTFGDALAARDRLLDVIVDFPLNDLGRAGWLSLLFTFAAPELRDGPAPMFGVDAHTAASGKGLLVRSAHIIAYGTDVPHMSLPPDEDEFRKQITTTLLAGDRAILLDNVTQPIGGDSLEALITAPVWKARLLGKNEDSGEIIQRLVTAATGNGIQLAGDMGRRTLRIRLDSPHENPEEREDYTYPERAGEDLFLAWVRAHRAELIVDALTCLRAWHNHGRQGEARSWGSFNGWVSTIARAVQWLGLPDPSEGRATRDAILDPTLRALDVIYAAIARLTEKRDILQPNEPRGLTAGDLVRAAFPEHGSAATGEDDLAEAIDALVPSRADAPTKARVLGRKLKAGRIIQGRKLVAEAERSRAVRYHLETPTHEPPTRYQGD